MIYTVGEMAQKLGVPASTLRYYDKEGLLPFVERSSGGIRMFRENDFEWLQVIRCMKKAGMSIKDIRQYIELSMQGDDTIDTRLEMFRHQREVLTQQIQQLQHTLETVEYKCWFYEAAKAAGTVDVPGAMTDADVPEQFRAIRQELRGQKIHRSRRRCNELLPACSRNVSELRPGRFHQTSFCSALLQCVQVSASCAPPSCLLSLPSPPCYNQSERRRYKYVGLPFFYRPVVYRPNR